MTIFISNLPYTLTQDQIRECFAQFGEVQAVRLARERETQQSRGFAFVEMEPTAALVAITDLHGRSWGGRTLRVVQAEDRPPR